MNLFELAIAKKISGGGSAPVIEPLSVTDNGEYSAPSGVDGYSPVTVNVPKGITPSGTKSITENGIYDVTNFASADVNVAGGGGGGASNIVWHKFTPSEPTSLTEVITIPYNGNGYPVEAIIYTADSTFGTTTEYRAAQSLHIEKINKAIAPDYDQTSNDLTSMCEVNRYNPTIANRLNIATDPSNRNFFASVDPSTGNLNRVRMISKNELKIRIAEKGTSNAGLMPGIEYTCIIMYSE